MTVNQVTTFFATGAIVIGAGITLIWITRLLGIWSAPARRLYDSVRESFHGYGLWLGWLMAVIATLGSLYYSQVAHFIPCEYCWYQRIAMYPLAVILGIAAFRNDTAVRRYALPLASIGGVIASYHYLIQQFPDLEVGSCSIVVPCATPYFEQFGFVTIPFLALVSFAAIITVLALDRPQND